MGSFPETYNKPHEVGLGVWLLPSGLDATPLIITGLPSSSMSPVPIYTLVKTDGRGMSPRPPDPEFAVLNVFSLKQTVNSTLGEKE